MHAKTHVASCPNSPLTILRLKRRLKGVNTQVCEQTFSWFRGYTRSFNGLRPLRHHFAVLYFAKKHNELVDKNDTAHLNEFSPSNQARKKKIPYPCMKKVKPTMKKAKKNMSSMKKKRWPSPRSSSQ